MNFRTIEPVTLASTRTRMVASPQRRIKRSLLLALIAALLLVAFAAGLVWWPFA
jgi:hypothetical protein